MALSAERREARRRHLVDAAASLVREDGGTGFSMLQLAERAGVSPATPYNLIGSKSELLRLLVADEFASFIHRLSALPPRPPLAHLLAATDAVVAHYTADPAFYRGLYRAAGGTEGGELRTLMQREGRQLWRGMVDAAFQSGELRPPCRSRRADGHFAAQHRRRHRSLARRALDNGTVRRGNGAELPAAAGRPCG